LILWRGADGRKEIYSLAAAASADIETVYVLRCSRMIQKFAILILLLNNSFVAAAAAMAAE